MNFPVNVVEQLTGLLGERRRVANGAPFRKWGRAGCTTQDTENCPAVHFEGVNFRVDGFGLGKAVI